MSLIPTTADIEYMKAHVGETRVNEVIAVNVTGLVIAIAAVGLRFTSRLLRGVDVRADDWVMVLALV